MTPPVHIRRTADRHMEIFIASPHLNNIRNELKDQELRNRLIRMGRLHGNDLRKDESLTIRSNGWTVRFRPMDELDGLIVKAYSADAATGGI